MNFKIEYHPGSLSGPTYSMSNDYDQHKIEPITTSTDLLRFSCRRRDGMRNKPFGMVNIEGGNAKRKVVIRGTSHELRMLAADLNKLAAWLESPVVDPQK